MIGASDTFLYRVLYVVRANMFAEVGKINSKFEISNQYFLTSWKDLHVFFISHDPKSNLSLTTSFNLSIVFDQVVTSSTCRVVCVFKICHAIYLVAIRKHPFSRSLALDSSIRRPSRALLWARRMGLRVRGRWSARLARQRTPFPTNWWACNSKFILNQTNSKIYYFIFSNDKTISIPIFCTSKFRCYLSEFRNK